MVIPVLLLALCIRITVSPRSIFNGKLKGHVNPKHKFISYHVKSGAKNSFATYFCQFEIFKEKNDIYCGKFNSG